MRELCFCGTIGGDVFSIILLQFLNFADSKPAINTDEAVTERE